jgi:hypothetical protein
MRILHSNAWLWLGSLLLVACPGDDTGEDGPVADSGASDTTAGTTAGTTEPGPTSTSEPGPTSTSESGPTSMSESGDTMITTVTTTDSDTTATSGDTETTGPSVGACGDAECSAAEWCDFSSNACSEKDAGSTATCEPRPEGCGDVYQPVCGCDGLTHSNECDANAVGIDVDAEGDCETPEGHFRCGYRFCNLDYEYCQIQYSDIGGYGHSYACMQAVECPEGGITCDCLTEEFCFEFGCEDTPDGGVQIGCPGG